MLSMVMQKQDSKQQQIPRQATVYEERANQISDTRHSTGSVGETTIRMWCQCIKNWCNQLPFLGSYQVFMDEEIRHKPVLLNVVKLQEAIHARNSIKGGSDFFKDAATKYKDMNFVPESMALYTLHVDFIVSQKLYLSIDKINAKDVKKRFTECRGKLNTVKNQWERSGSGKVMATAADREKQARLEKELYEFKDGDD
jgi:hypothetical protein